MVHTISSGRFSRDAFGFINFVALRLALDERAPQRTFHCEVIQDESPNALALPGGFIFIHHSLVDFCERRPDELASMGYNPTLLRRSPDR